MLFPRISILALCALSLNLGACSKDYIASGKTPGTFEKTTQSTDADGTYTEKRTSTRVGFDTNGNQQTEVKSKVTTDPTGMFNKTTSTSATKKTEATY